METVALVVPIVILTGLVILAIIQTILNLRLGRINPKTPAPKMEIHRAEAQIQIAAMLTKTGVDLLTAMDLAAKMVVDQTQTKDLLKEVEAEVAKEAKRLKKKAEKPT